MKRMMEYFVRLTKLPGEEELTEKVKGVLKVLKFT
jgi:hypothetical protein